MTEQQKKAIQILNNLMSGKQSGLEEEEYFLLLEFVVTNQPSSLPLFPAPYNPYPRIDTPYPQVTYTYRQDTVKHE